MILGVGTDLCEISRIQKAMENERFAQRVFTEAERARFAGLCPERLSEHAAGLFAAKEAVAKAMGTGFSGFGFSDIEILPDEKGRPCAALSERARVLIPDGAKIHLSISHDGGMALAFAVLSQEDI